jgi:hypothetical protein
MYPTDEALISTYIENLCWGDFKGMMSQRNAMSKSLNNLHKSKGMFRSSQKLQSKLPSGARIDSSLNIMSGLTNLINSDIMNLKKKNQEERRKYRKKMSDKSMIKHMKKLKHLRNRLPEVSSSKAKKDKRLQLKFFQELER